MIKGLSRLNARIRTWEQLPDYHWWPGREKGVSCLWLGEPGGKSTKISACTHGPFTEFTQLSPDGGIMAKGWRGIFEAVIKCGGATRMSLEKEFKVDLGIDHNASTGYCEGCMKMGIKAKGHGVRNMCNMHSQLEKNVEKALDSKREADFQTMKAGIA